MLRFTSVCIIFCLAITTAQLDGQTPSCAAASGEYGVLGTFKPGGDGRWDYLVVGENHLLYVTRSTHTQVIDPATKKVVADIPGGSRMHGTALATKAGRGFVTDGKDGKLLVFDLKTNAPLGKVDAADDADGTIYDSGTDRVLVTCGDAGQLLVLDPHPDVASMKVEKIDLDGKPEFLAADGKGMAYVCVNDKSLIAAVDLKTMKVVNRWPCGTGTDPTGLSIDPTGGHLFIGCRNQKLIVMGTSDGKVEAELPIGKGNDACGYDPELKLAFASCGDGTLAVIEETGAGVFQIKEKAVTLPGARTMAIDPTTHTIYLATAEFAPAVDGKRPTPLPDSFKIVVVAAHGMR